MINGAAVEPAYLRKMKEKIEELTADLARTSKELINRTEELNQKGFQDAHFESLYSVINERKEDLEKLKNIMQSFSDLLIRLEKNIVEYNNQKIK